MLKTYFCELVLGFLPDRNQTSLGQFYGVSRSIIIKKKLNFCIFHMSIFGHKENGSGKMHSKAYKSYIKTQNFTKIGEHMWHNIINNHAKFYGDRTIGGAITVKKTLKPYISYGKLPVLAVNCLFHLWSYNFHIIMFKTSAVQFSGL